MKAKAMVIVFVLTLGGLTVLNLLTPSKSFSENENRYLKELPEFSVQSLVSGKYTGEIEEYVIDQFAFRDQWVGMKALSELALQKKSSNGVYFARGGYLIEMFDSMDQPQFERNLGHVETFSRRVEDNLGAEVHALLAPTASLVHSDRLPRNTPEVDQLALLEQADAALPHLVDVSGAMLDHRDAYIYYRTDHHWTSLGAYYAYADWRAKSGKPVPGRDRYREELLSDSFYGTTWSKASLYTTKPDDMTAFVAEDLGPYSVEYFSGDEITVRDSIYERSFLEVKDKYSTFLNANQPLTHITTGQGSGKLLLVKDSFANSFVQMALPDYEEIYLIDLRYYKLSVYDFIEDNGITDVLVLYNMKNFTSDTNLYYLST